LVDAIANEAPAAGDDSAERKPRRKVSNKE
jgi:hypothetical protein